MKNINSEQLYYKVENKDSDLGEVDYCGYSGLNPISTSCRFHKTKNGKYYRCHAPSQRACEHFESI